MRNTIRMLLICAHATLRMTSNKAPLVGYETFEKRQCQDCVRIPSNRFSTTYVEMLLIYGECGRNARAAAMMYAQRIPNRNHLNHEVILSAITRTIEIDHILPNRKETGGAPLTV
jgi:hypothetical protein